MKGAEIKRKIEAIQALERALLLEDEAELDKAIELAEKALVETPDQTLVQ